MGSRLSYKGHLLLFVIWYDCITIGWGPEIRFKLGFTASITDSCESCPKRTPNQHPGCTMKPIKGGIRDQGFEDARMYGFQRTRNRELRIEVRPSYGIREVPFE
jgi:hypothetical protein